MLVNQKSLRPTRKVKFGFIAGLVSTAVTAALVSFLGGQKINLSEENQQAIESVLTGVIVSGASAATAYLTRNEG